MRITVMLSVLLTLPALAADPPEAKAITDAVVTSRWARGLLLVAARFVLSGQLAKVGSAYQLTLRDTCASK